MNIKPKSIQRIDDQTIQIEWSDGITLEYNVKDLRKQCPCALCKEKRMQREEQNKNPLSLPVLTPAETAPIRLTGMKPVGNYAYHIDFSDGHTTGIYTFDILRSIGNEVVK